MHHQDNSTLAEAILLLNNKETFEKIANFAKETCNSPISICFPLKKSEQDKVYFLLEKKHPGLSFVEIARLAVNVREELNYENVKVELKDAYREDAIANLFADITPIINDNFQKLEEFLNKHYSHLLTNMTKPSEPKQQLRAGSLWNKDKRPRVELGNNDNDLQSHERVQIDDIETRVERLSPRAREELFERLNKFKQQRFTPNPITGTS